ncbi:hypothetical protein NOR_04852 [Metarhizium rileyi]|uniref:Uncharacterized protein n=1 Tax=Metarhizium rileyi (strain RCEF 4871) TaxID=1649241 RepID=A0A167DQK1_METRR|nr:hypothetical protein NOR_04852 [Metarhizium rileyi RCEF 4871]TWU77041.1 hypothetical protein ED733_007793 [Metarhizium rileyi]
MDKTSPADINSTSPPVADPSAASSTQPTYTTAGTIYRPSSSQPLQPPARRGRLPKWPAGGIHSDLALFPKSALAGLSMKAPVGRPSALQQYTPLQQNNHRAVSPFSDPDHLAAKMPMEIPRIRSGNALNLISASLSEEGTQETTTTEDDGHRSADDSDEGSDDDGANMTLLRHLPVQSLHNLASYQNPNQKYAQKALQPGTRPRPPALGSSSMGTTTSSTPPILSAFSPRAGSGEVGGPPNMNLQGNSDVFALRRGQMDPFTRTDDVWDVRNGASTSVPPNPPNASSSGSEYSRPSGKSVSANGTLLPLTAGPPGQRQYRPLAVESTIKTMAATGPSSPAITNAADDHTILITNRVLKEAGIDDVSIDSLGSFFAGTSNSGDGDIGPQPPTLPRLHGYGEGMQNHFTPFNNSLERMKVWDPRERLIMTKSWRDPSPEVRALYKPGTDRLNEEAMAAHNRQLEEWWYSGINNAYRRVGGTPLNRPQKQQADTDFGVIGDRRPKKPLSPSEKDSVQEGAADISASEHVKLQPETSTHARSPNEDEPTADSQQQ